MATESNPKKSKTLGTLIIILVIIMSSYGIYNGLNQLTQSRNERAQWTSDDRNMLVDKCVNEYGDNGKKYPELTRTFCECSNDKILEKFTKAEYVEIIKKPTDEQLEISLPIFQDCLTDYQSAINQIENGLD